MAREDEDFLPIWGLIGSYLHQDMDLDADSVPEVIAHFARDTGEPGKAEILRSMDDFVQRYQSDPEAEFHRRWHGHFLPGSIGQTVPEFFAMVRAIVEDPVCYPRFEPNVERGIVAYNAEIAKRLKL